MGDLWKDAGPTAAGLAATLAGLVLLSGAPASGAPQASVCVAARTDANGGPYPADKPSDCTGQSEVRVLVTGDPSAGGGFAPSNILVRKGAKVTWVWEDGGHNLSPFHPAIEDQGFSFSRTFDEAGSFPYLCQVHPAQRGMIVVRA